MAKKPLFQVCDVNPVFAKNLLEHNMFPGQRPVSPSHVTYLTNLMKAGTFRENTIVTLAYLKQNTDQAQCVNGQHTLHAVVRANVTQRLVLEYRQVDSLDDIAILYASYDRGRMRSMVDAVQAFQGLRDSGLGRTQITLLSGAIPVVTSGFDGLENSQAFMALMRNAATRYQFMEPWFGEMLAMSQIVHGENRENINRVMKRAAVLAVALTTMRYQRHMATTFWRRLVTDNGLVKGDPAKTLLNFLIATPSVHLKPHVYARYVASAWNAECDGRTIGKLYAREGTTPILLDGTPHKGNATMQYYSDDGKYLEHPVKKA